MNDYTIWAFCCYGLVCVAVVALAWRGLAAHLEPKAPTDDSLVDYSHHHANVVPIQSRRLVRQQEGRHGHRA